MTAFAGDLPLCKGSTTVAIPAALQGRYSAPGIQLVIGEDGIKQVNAGSTELTYANRVKVKGEDTCISRKASEKNGKYTLAFETIQSDGAWYGYGTERDTLKVKLTNDGASYSESGTVVALLLWVIPAANHSWSHSVALVKQP
jgi:hypothetical protein